MIKIVLLIALYVGCTTDGTTTWCHYKHEGVIYTWATGYVGYCPLTMEI